MATFPEMIFGSKPRVPDLPALNLETEQKKAIGANIKALPATEKLVGQANLFTQQQIQQMLERSIPGFNQITAQTSGNIESMLKGELPLSDLQQTELRSVAKAFGGGFGGSGAQGNLVARDLGLTQLGVIQQGLSSAQSWISQMNKIYSPGMLDLSSMFITPTQMAGFDVAEREAQFQRSWMENQISAMGDPVLSGIYEDIYGLAQSFVGGMGSKIGGAI